MLRKTLSFLLLLTLVATSALAAEATLPQTVKQPLVFDLVLGDPQGSEMDVVANEFRDYVRKLSNGDMDINITYGGSMGEDETFHFHNVQKGRQDMALGGVGNLTPLVRPLGVVMLPYIFSNIDEVVRGTTGEAAGLLNAYARSGGLNILAWTYCGFRHFSNSKRPVASMDDMKSLRVRVPQSVVMVESYRGFGAIPSAIPWNMTYKSLEHNLVDGQCYDYAGFKVMKFADVGQKYITELHAFYNLQPLVMNEQKFRDLQPEMQNVLVQAGQHAQIRSLRYQNEMIAKAKQDLVAAGVHITTIADESLWKAQAQNRIWPRVVDGIGGEKRLNEYLRLSGLPAWQ